jgi:hypothetical protein
MRPWLTRGVVLALVLSCADVGLAAMAVRTSSLGTVRPIVLGVIAGAAALWAALDGWRRLDDRGQAWLFASLFAGFTSGLLRVIGRAVFVDETGLSSLGSALTGDAAFTALLFLIPAGLGLLVGGRLAQRETTKAGPAE